MATSETTKAGVSYLVPPETEAETGGAGETVALAGSAGKSLLIVLRLADIIEQESLHVSIWGSVDGKEWGDKALFWFPQVFYRGAKPAALDLRQRPEIKFLQARWEVNRWGRGYPRPHFRFSVGMEELAAG